MKDEKKSKDETKKEKKADIPGGMKFVIGGLSGMTATLFVQPMDLLKNRMQLSSAAGKEFKGSFDAFTTILKNEGFFALYNGLSAGLLRQATYSSARLGVYTWLLSNLTQADGTPPGFLSKLGIGCVAGIAGAFVGNPSEIALIRMTADGKLPPQERRNYKNVFDALIRIVKEEGFMALGRGMGATMGRAVIINAVQLATYSECKEMYMRTGYFKNNSIPLHFASSMTSGLLTALTSMPVDIVKTRIQNMKTVNGKPEYSGALDVVTKIIQKEGVLALWKGFMPYLLRVGPHTVLTLVFLEQYTKLYRKYFL